MHDNLRFEDGPDEATRTLIPSGELDAAAAARVRKRTEDTLGAGKRRVIVDLSDVSYMETGALNELLDANARLKRFGATMVVVVPHDSRVRRIFSITRLDKVLEVFETREQAQGSP